MQDAGRLLRDSLKEDHPRHSQVKGLTVVGCPDCAKANGASITPRANDPALGTGPARHRIGFKIGLPNFSSMVVEIDEPMLPQESESAYEARTMASLQRRSDQVWEEAMWQIERARNPEMRR